MIYATLGSCVRIRKNESFIRIHSHWPLYNRPKRVAVLHWFSSRFHHILFHPIKGDLLQGRNFQVYTREVRISWGDNYFHLFTSSPTNFMHSSQYLISTWKAPPSKNFPVQTNHSRTACMPVLVPSVRHILEIVNVCD